jgi:hypothetical protein
MKKRILSVFLSFILITVAFAGCSNFTPLTGGPTLEASVSGNGGMAVRKGDYLYFVNGFTNSSALIEGANEYGNEENSAIYRAELDSSGELMIDEEGNLINIEILIPKVVGFNNGGFYIFDDYIYYATPTILKDRSGAVRFDLVDFYRAKLDGTKVKKLYATNDYPDTATFSFYKKDGDVQLVLFDGTDLISKKVSGSLGATNVMASDISGAMLPEVTDYVYDTSIDNDTQGYVYYTRALNDSDNTILELGNVLAKIEIGTTTEEVLVQDNINIISIYRIQNNQLYYIKVSQNSVSNQVFTRSIEGDFEQNTEIKLTATFYDNMEMLDFDNGNNQGVVVVDEGKLIRITDVFSEDGYTLLSEDVTKVLFTRGDYVYYTFENRLMRINYKTLAIDYLSNEDEVVYIEPKLNIDYDSEYVYYYVTHVNNLKESHYLHRTKVATTTFEGEFVGVLEEADIPEPETEEEPTE